jgi:hypothetical protein
MKAKELTRPKLSNHNKKRAEAKIEKVVVETLATIDEPVTALQANDLISELTAAGINEKTLALALARVVRFGGDAPTLRAVELCAQLLSKLTPNQTVNLIRTSENVCPICQAKTTYP